MAYDVSLTGSARSSLVALQKTQSALDKTNTRLNTGKKVDGVIDDVVAFFSAKALNERASDFEDGKAAIDQSIGAINVALTATHSIDSLLKQLKGIVTAAKTASAAERGVLFTQFNTVKNQIDQLVADATYQGTNLVSASTARLDTQFSERSASRLVVAGQRLSTYQTVVPEASRQVGYKQPGGVVGGGQYCLDCGVGGILDDSAGENIFFQAGATGIYHATYGLNGGIETRNFIRYNTIRANNAEFDAARVRLDSLYGQSFRLDTVYIASRDDNPSPPVAWDPTVPRSILPYYQTQFTEVSGLNIFMASQIFIVADMWVTGSHAITTLSTGTLWSMADFDSRTGLASKPFSEALDFVMEGIDASIRQNNGMTKTLGSNLAILNARLEFTQAYVNVQKGGAGKLTLTDPSEEGASLVALQTRQQLGIQALAFAGQSEQAVLRLFR